MRADGRRKLDIYSTLDVACLWQFRCLVIASLAARSSKQDGVLAARPAPLCCVQQHFCLRGQDLAVLLPGLGNSWGWQLL